MRQMPQALKELLREPLLHFLLLGASIFAVDRLVSKRGGEDPELIVISEGRIAALAEGFARNWQRPPTSEELEGLIRDRVREEVYCREALALGLDQEDPVIRHRLRQKMEFITNDVAALAEPTDAELSAYLDAHPDVFRVQPQFSFAHVYLNLERHGENLERDAAQLLAQLKQAGAHVDVPTLGDPFLLEHEFQAVPLAEVGKLFGETFATALGHCPRGQWQGPVESGYGAHLVLVHELTEGRIPVLGEVRDAVRREWANAHRLDANEKLYQELLKRYSVIIERPQPVEGQKKLAARR